MVELRYPWMDLAASGELLLFTSIKGRSFIHSLISAVLQCVVFRDTQKLLESSFVSTLEKQQYSWPQLDKSL